MNCPKCNSSQTKVIETRWKPDNSVRRRRECLCCGFRFSTIEVLV